MRNSVVRTANPKVINLKVLDRQNPYCPFIVHSVLRGVAPALCFLLGWTSSQFIGFGQANSLLGKTQYPHMAASNSLVSSQCRQIALQLDKDGTVLSVRGDSSRELK